MDKTISPLLPIQSSAPAALLGVLSTLVATTCYNLDPAIQKEGLNELPILTTRSIGSQPRLLFGNRKWLIGFSVSLAMVSTNLAAIALVGMVVVQPLLGFGLLALVW